jgi:hypothetical protein
VFEIWDLHISGNKVFRTRFAMKRSWLGRLYCRLLQPMIKLKAISVKRTVGTSAFCTVCTYTCMSEDHNIYIF